VFPRRIPLLTLALAGAAAACGDAKLYPYAKADGGIGGMGGTGGTGGLGGTAGKSDCSDKLLGFAAVASTDADGGVAGPTTGGNIISNPPLTVRTVAELTAALQSSEPLVIFLDGMLTTTATIKVTLDKDLRNGNKTLIGMGANSGLTGAGLDLGYADNVIVRNLKISNVSVGEGDAITILDSHHIWIDHCDLSSVLDDATAGYDGLVDITHGSTNVTVSWTVFHDHNDTSLVGHSADATQMAEDSVLSVTYHHNHFLRVHSGPRIRWGTAHVANNHFESVSTFGIASESLATVFVDSNMFEDDVSMAIITTYLDPTPGTMVEKGDRFPRGFTPDIMRPTTAPPPLPYSYTPDGTDNLAALINACAGTGKLGY
jgi:pectate lyase